MTLQTPIRDRERGLRGPGLTSEQQAQIVIALSGASFGNFIDRLRPFGSEASNGASLIGDTGISIASGATGIGSFVRPRWEKSLADFTGARVIIKIEVTKSATFTRNLQTVLQVSTASDFFVTRMDGPGTVASSVTDGDKTIYTFVYLVQGDETAIQPYVQIATSPATASVESFEVTGISFAFAEVEDEFAPARDHNIELLKDDIRSRMADLFQSGTGNIIDGLSEFGQAVANGAVISGEFEISVPSGSTGAGSYLRPRWEKVLADYIGARVEVKLRIKQSTVFTRQLVPTFQISTAGSPFITRSADLSTRDDVGETVYIYTYTVQGDEVALNPYVSINPGQTTPAATDETFELTGFSFGVIETAGAFLTPADHNADLVKDDVLTQAHKFTILRPTFVDTITVKASGGDFTTMSAAIAAITDPSIRRQWKIAWFAGATIGTPDFHIPPYTAIVCQDRTEDAILSFANANGASAGTITNTSLAWIDEDGIVIDGGTWRITNGRYVFHWETNGELPDTKQTLVNLVAEHLGNASAVNNAWGIASQVALGIGVSGGQVLDVSGCRTKGPGGGLLAHSPANIDWTTAFDINLSHSRFEATDAAYPDLVLKPIRRGPGRTSIVGCSFDELSYTDAEWIGGNPGSGVNTAQIQVTATGNVNLAGSGDPTFDNNVTLGAAAGAAYTWFRPGR